MSSDTSIDIREVIFVNRAAEEAYRGLPDEVRQAADARTTAIQNHQPLPRNHRQSLSGKLAGIDEVRILSDGDTYRVYHLVEFAEVIYILDAGMKKSPTGSRMPRPQSEMLERRKKFAQDDFDQNKGEYRIAMQERLMRRRVVGVRRAEAASRREPMTTKENSGPVRGSGDFLQDMGYDDPDEMRVKFTLANTIAMAIEQRHLKQAEVAKLTGLAQPDISRIVNGVVKDYSLMRLMRVLTALGKDISIGITDTSGGRGVIIAKASNPEPAATGR